MADGAGAAAGINGDFFDIGRSNAPVGPEVRGGRPVKAGVPPGRRYGPAVPGVQPDHVFAVGADGVGRIDRLALDAQVRGPGDPLPAVALNQHAVPVGGIGIVTAEWGAADRGRMLCGSDTDPAAPCAAERLEVQVRDGAVTTVGAPGTGTLGPGETALEGREQGAAALRSLPVGTRVEVAYALRPASGVAPTFAIGGCPILLGRAPVAGLDTRERAPRSAVGVSSGGRRNVPGDRGRAAGRERGSHARAAGHAAIRDGARRRPEPRWWGSSTLVFRAPGAGSGTIVNDPSDPSARLVPNGIGVWSG